jgi:hypothetical protein
MSSSAATYRAGIIGLGFIGARDQVSGDALGQQVRDLDGTHLAALAHCPRIKLVAGSSRDVALMVSDAGLAHRHRLPGEGC